MGTLAQNLSFVLLGEDKSASSAMSGVESTATRVTQKIGGAFSKLGGVIGGELGAVLQQAGDGVQQFGDKALARTLQVGGGIATGLGVALMSMASADKAATDQLKAAVGASGAAWSDYADQIGEAVAQGQNFGHEGEDTTNALRVLTQATDDTQVALDNMGLVTDLAAAKHISLEDAAGLVAKILNGGGARALKDYGIKMEQNADGTMNAQKALDELSRKLDGQAIASMQNFGAQVGVVKTKIVDWVQEMAGPLGQALVIIGPVLTVVGVALDVYKNRQVAATVASLAQTTASVAATTATEVQTVAQTGLNVAMDANPIGLVVGALGLLAGVLMAGGILDNTLGLSAATQDYTDTLDSNTGAITENTRVKVAQTLIDDGTMKRALELGIMSSDLVGAVMGNEEDLARVNEKLDLALDGAAAGAYGMSDAQIRAAESVGKVQSSIGNQSQTIKDNIATNQMLRSSLDDTKAKMADTQQQANDYAASLRNVPSEVNTTVRQYFEQYGSYNSSGYGMPHLASGGIATRPTVALIGESGPEAIVPLNSGRLASSGGGGGVTLQLTVQGALIRSEDLAKELTTALVNGIKSGAVSRSELARAIGV